MNNIQYLGGKKGQIWRNFKTFAPKTTMGVLTLLKFVSYQSILDMTMCKYPGVTYCDPPPPPFEKVWLRPCMLLNTVDCKQSPFWCEIQLERARKKEKRARPTSGEHRLRPLFLLSSQSDFTAKEILFTVYKHSEKLSETRWKSTN